MAMDTAYDFKKLLTIIYEHNDTTNGQIIDYIATIDDNILAMLDEINSKIASYDMDSKEIPVDVIISTLTEYDSFARNLRIMVHNYKLIKDKAAMALVYLDKLQRVIK